MVTAAEVKQRFASRGIERAGCWLIDAATAIEVIEDLDRNKIPLNGIEGYWLSEGKIQPSLEHSVYFLGEDIRRESLPGTTVTEKALSFIGSKAKLGLMFDLDFEST
jgi:hypothetical protein